MNRGPQYESLNTDEMVYAWIRYGDEFRGLNGAYASDLRFHFYTRRNSNHYSEAAQARR